MVILHHTNTHVRNAIDWVGVLVNPSFYDHKKGSRTTSTNSLIIGIQRIQADISPSDNSRNGQISISHHYKIDGIIS